MNRNKIDTGIGSMKAPEKILKLFTDTTFSLNKKKDIDYQLAEMSEQT